MKKENKEQVKNKGSKPKKIKQAIEPALIFLHEENTVEYREEINSRFLKNYLEGGKQMSDSLKLNVVDQSIQVPVAIHVDLLPVDKADLQHGFPFVPVAPHLICSLYTGSEWHTFLYMFHFQYITATLTFDIAELRCFFENATRTFYELFPEQIERDKELIRNFTSNGEKRPEPLKDLTLEAMIREYTFHKVLAALYQIESFCMKQGITVFVAFHKLQDKKIFDFFETIYSQ